jgi:hypothetical protein
MAMFLDFIRSNGVHVRSTTSPTIFFYFFTCATYMPCLVGNVRVKRDSEQPTSYEKPIVITLTASLVIHNFSFDIFDIDTGA